MQRLAQSSIFTKSLLAMKLTFVLVFGPSAPSNLAATRPNTPELANYGTVSWNSQTPLATTGTNQERARDAISKLPSSFEANRGQAVSTVKLSVRGSAYTPLLTSLEAVLRLHRTCKEKNACKPAVGGEKFDRTRDGQNAVIKMKLAGANSNLCVEGLDQLPAKVNYFTGNDPKKWRAGLSNCARGEYYQVYSGIVGRCDLQSAVGHTRDVCLLTLNVTAQTSRDAASYCQRGFEQFQRGDLDAAIADFTTAVTFDPSYVRAYLNRAMVWFRKNRLDEALNDFNKTIDLEPRSADAYNGRGNVYIDLGEYETAIANFSRAIEINPRHVAAYTNRGIARQVNWQTDEAIADYGKAIELSPGAAEAYHNRGTGAIADYTKALQLEPSYVLAYAHRASVFASKGRSVEAAKDYQMCLKLNRALGEFLRDRLYLRQKPESSARSTTSTRP